MASVANAFSLLTDDAVDVDISAEAAAAPVKKVEAPKPAADEPKASRPASAGARGGRGEAVAGRGAGRGGRGAGRGPRPASRGEDAPAFDADTAPTVRGRGERGPPGGRGGGRGGRGPRAGKREYDRQDGTGRGHETEKRHGGGAHNWGEEGKDGETEGAAKEATTEEGAEPAAEPVEEVPRAEPEEDEEEKQMTLEEYEVVLAEKRAGLNQQREAAFKADEKQFSGMKTFEKVVEDVGLSLKNVKVIGANKAGREKERKEKEVLDVAFRIASDTDTRGGRGEGRGRGGRGEGRGEYRGERREGRGGGRGFSGRGGRGEGRGEGRGAGAAAPLDLESAFPALGQA
ncbi:expressed protein [Chlorella variabilis]|uniref:Expressed protein n=1 Tax=Chlorella variabilis TaxID=554065 RepID=E1ZMD5_CHLVA|nr:expressed protein [Chlorella variabilis]EFN52985.1 expressed protein [Chlorella variabilis]|eukprot:XP_005845087.1 expressed protein [Chlorella variabilis]